MNKKNAPAMRQHRQEQKGNYTQVDISIKKLFCQLGINFLLMLAFAAGIIFVLWIGKILGASLW